MLDKSNSTTSDLAYLESELDTYFGKITYNLQQNFSKEEAIVKRDNILSKILTDNLPNKEQLLTDLSNLEKFGTVLAEAVDEVDKTLNDGRNSSVFSDIQENQKTKGGVVANDAEIQEFINEYSKPYLTKLCTNTGIIKNKSTQPQSNESTTTLDVQEDKSPSSSPETINRDSEIRKQEQLMEFLGITEEQLSRIDPDIKSTIYNNAVKPILASSNQSSAASKLAPTSTGLETVF